MIKFILGVIRKYFILSETRYARYQRQLLTFDIVSPVENPTIDNLYVLYQINDTNVQLIRWKEYTKNNKFEATLDNMLEYPFTQIRDEFYKVVDQSVNPGNLIRYSTPAELQVYATRINHAFGLDCPLMGLYIDKRTKHMMLVTTKVGDVAKGYCIVHDMTLAKSAGITHNEQIIHIARVKDVLDKQVIRAVCLEDIIGIFNGSWRKEVLDNVSAQFIRSIRTSESKFDTFKLYAKGITTLQKVQDIPNSMDKSPSDSPQSKKVNS